MSPLKHQIILFFLVVAGFFSNPAVSHAYGLSEREEMKEDIREALSRAKDFHSQKVREATENLERERGAKEVKAKREAFEAEEERTRESYIRERNSKPSEFLLQARLERSFDESKIIEEREMDKNRQVYARDHRKVQRIIKRKAHINEAEEFGL